MMTMALSYTVKAIEHSDWYSVTLHVEYSLNCYHVPGIQLGPCKKDIVHQTHNCARQGCRLGCSR